MYETIIKNVSKYFNLENDKDTLRYDIIKTIEDINNKNDEILIIINMIHGHINDKNIHPIDQLCMEMNKLIIEMININEHFNKLCTDYGKCEYYFIKLSQQRKNIINKFMVINHMIMYKISIHNNKSNI